MINKPRPTKNSSEINGKISPVKKGKRVISRRPSSKPGAKVIPNTTQSGAKVIPNTLKRQNRDVSEFIAPIGDQEDVDLYTVVIQF